MNKIILEGLKFFAYHGFYEEERKIGNRYGVDLTVSLNFEQAAEADRIKATVNYESLYKIVKEEMDMTSKLLEHIGLRIVKGVFDNYEAVLEVEVTIRKFNPPVGGVCKSSAIYIQKSRAEHDAQL